MQQEGRSGFRVSFGNYLKNLVGKSRRSNSDDMTCTEVCVEAVIPEQEKESVYEDLFNEDGTIELTGITQEVMNANHHEIILL